MCLLLAKKKGGGGLSSSAERTEWMTLRWYWVSFLHEEGSEVSTTTYALLSEHHSRHCQWTWLEVWHMEDVQHCTLVFCSFGVWVFLDTWHLLQSRIHVLILFGVCVTSMLHICPHLSLDGIYSEQRYHWPRLLYHGLLLHPWILEILLFRVKHTFFNLLLKSADMPSFDILGYTLSASNFYSRKCWLQSL